MREFGLLHETDPSLPIPRLESSLYDDYESFLPLESNIIDDAPLTNLEEVLNPPLTYSPLIAPSSSGSPLVTSTTDPTLLDSPFPLAQCMGLEMGEIFRGDVSVLDDTSLLRSKELTLVRLHLEEAPFEELCGELVMGTDTPSIGPTDPIGNKPLDLTPSSSPLPLTIRSHLQTFHESLGDIKGYNPSLNPYCANLEDVPRTITWSTFFDHTFDFSMEFDEFKRPLTLFVVSHFRFLEPNGL